ncbi:MULTISPECIES: flagellar basal body rod protein FlgF [unclassified Photorhabdus]|uniref:flagellar basal body rod protein FlgF n=1 Tax=unclassified Photorhabdus TaxID=2620880 RepID=UPI000DCDA4EF|nr:MULTISPECIES: flagellar basal body rod protein FlgF [unclassified Photorhabdus]RAW94660.1 flagellar biosynthesis protein FlgF [Photorhabdus sp. S9-53]RAW94824.1 flagellar biosynthesis protein FlgF [Photorhabdus sp. S10-54]RAW98928.1 flagellar biosynthesis protein FlgF [Photorhabdus sp. S8-52]
MDHVIYTAMGGARQTLEHQAVTANNLANASTSGFKAQLAALRAVPVEGATFNTRTLVVASTPGFDNRQGPMNYTSRPLDVAIGQGGYLAVQLEEGSEAYTRNGSIQISAEGQLTVQGNLLMGDNGPINVPPQAELTLATDGSISALIPGDPPTQLGQLGRLKMVKPESDQLVRGDDGLFHMTEQAQTLQGNVLPASDEVKLIPGVLEGSNVNPMESMVSMIANARRFEMQMKVIHSSDENAQRANQLLAMS